MTAVQHTWMDSVRVYCNGFRDPRTEGWLFVGDPTPLVLLSTAYLYFTCIFGPNYMRNRKPYSLKTAITLYNIGQILSCTYIVRGFLTSGWLDEFTFGCQPLDGSDNPKAYKMAAVAWWAMLLRIAEFAETIFFVLRKKGNQITTLHLYHHVSSLFVYWLCCRIAPGGMATFGPMLNSFVHIIMYTYYVIALHGSRELRSRLISVKKCITIMQMVQFIVMVVHGLSSFRPDCDIPKTYSIVCTLNVTFLYYLFYKFYQKTYTKPKE